VDDVSFGSPLAGIMDGTIGQLIEMEAEFHGLGMYSYFVF